MISIHAPQWGATEVAAGVVLVLVISIHAPQWGATPENGPSFAGENDFNPRTPVGCDRSAGRARSEQKISIHAPQWGATKMIDSTNTMMKFQSTHPSGVRRIRFGLHQSGNHFNPRTPVGCDHHPPPRWNAWNFNPRTPVGCDVGHLSGFGARQVISIHAPQWGATKRGFRRKIDAEFQSTHPSGVRLDGVAGSASPVAFQSTHPSGVRPAMKNAIMLQFKFQSTHPSGVRRGRCADPRLIVEFQSTHPSGVRPSFRWRVSFFYAISIHAPQWGATGQRGWNLGHSVISIHAPQWGATRARSRLAPRRLHFNPRTPVGCDAFPDRYRFGVDISIHVCLFNRKWAV